MKNRKAQTLIQLVGSNPLPNYICTRMQDPERVVLLCSTQTEEVANALRASYNEQGIASSKVLIANPTDWKSCEDTVRPEFGKHNLDYTGGTKIMAVHVYKKWMEYGGKPQRASYVDDYEEAIRFDDGRTDGITVDLEIATLLKIHGLKDYSSEENGEGFPTTNDARTIALNFFRGNYRKEKVLEALKKRNYDNLDSYIREMLDLLLLKRNKDLTKTWKNFFSGKWLELLIADLVIETGIIDSAHVARGLSTLQQDGVYELDVVAVRGHRAYVISCTTSDDFTKAKEKAFEVIIRGKQFGGDLARCALIAPLKRIAREGNRGMKDKAENLSSTMRSIWDSPNPLRVFGEYHLKNWVGIHGDPDLTSLSEWLQS